jgi:AraC-like DNA-binding protein
MPLFMDFHKIDNITIDDVVKAHMADVAIQDKYGVHYHQFWVNVKAGTVFCLTEGPDAETCEMVHKLAHGNLACAITEVEVGDYQKIMGLTPPDSNGLSKLENQAVDPGYRTILVASLRNGATMQNPAKSNRLDISTEVRRTVLGKISHHNGREIEWPIGDRLIAVFNEAADAIKCVHQIEHTLMSAFQESKVIYRMGISAEQPLTEDGTFFTKAIKLAERLSFTADDNQTLISSLAKQLCRDDLPKTQSLRFLNDADERFVSDLLDVTEQHLSDSDYSIERLCRDLGISRPQLYRKMTALTGRAPNNFLRDLRMEKAVNLLKRKAGNISEVALDVGFTNPSYFTKRFAGKFGCMPSEVSHG